MSRITGSMASGHPSFMKKLLIILSAVLVMLVVGVPVTTRILGPRLIYVSAPGGKPLGEVDAPRPETSLLAVSIGIELATLAALANEKVPPEFEGAEEKDFHKNLKAGGYAWKVTRGPIAFQNNGSHLTFTAPIQGAAQFQGTLDAKIVQIPLNTTAELAGIAGGSLSPTIAPDWSITPNLTPALNLSQASLSLGSLGKLDVSDILGSSVGQYIQQEAQKLAPALRQSIDLRSEVELLWREAYLSEQVNDSPKIWLSVTPREVQLSPIDYTNPEELTVTAAIKTDAFLTNREPGNPQPQPLPSLVAQPGPLSTDLKLPIIASINELNEVLAEENFEIDTGAGTSVKIDGLEAAVGQDGMLNLKLSLNASQSGLTRGIAGDIWLEARPMIDFEGQALGFTDVDFTLETKSKLTSVATWLLEELLIKAIEREMRVDLDDYKEELTEEIYKTIDSAALSEDIKVSIDDLDIQLYDIYTITRPFPDAEESPGLVVVIRATGNLATRFGQLDAVAPAPTEGP